MADYLTRLVERTLGLAPTVRPDVPPAFAPEAREPAPHDAPGLYPPPDPGYAGAATRRSRPEPYPGPPERARDDADVAREANHEPDVIPRYEIPFSTAARPPDGRGRETERAPEPPVTKNTGESREIDHHSPGPGADNQEPSRGPEQLRRSSDSAPQDATVAHGSPEAEISGEVKNDDERRVAPPSASSTERSESPSGRYEPETDLDELHDAPSRSSPRSGGRPGAGHRGTPDSGLVHQEPEVGSSEIPTGPAETTSPRRRTSDPASAVEGVAPPTEGIAPDRPVSQTDGRGGRDKPSGLVHERGSDLVADPQVRRSEKPAASDRKKDRPGSLRRAVLEAPLVPVANRPRATPRGREVGEEISSPTVRVTIGRVEVRAVMPEPAPQPPPPPAMREPALSLEDYLEQHAGGRP